MSSFVSFETSGAGLQTLRKMELKSRAEALMQIIEAGAEAAENVWRDEIKQRGYVSRNNGYHMWEAVGHTNPEANSYGISCEVYPLGEDDRGVRQRAKAAYIENKNKSMYRGVYWPHKTADKRFKGTQGKQFINNSGGINEKAVPAAQAAMAEKFKEITGE